MSIAPASLLTLVIRHDQDVVTARQRAGDISALLGFESGEQTRVATAVSEIVRNAFRYAGSGYVEFLIDRNAQPQTLTIAVVDRGQGIPHLERVLNGTYQSSTGMGLGITGARRLMDEFQIESIPGRGTSIVMQKALPPRAPLVTEARVTQILRAIRSRQPAGIAEEFQRQNQELLRALDELQTRQDELVRLNRELEDTNRGVVALYAELDEKADHLRRADELKSRFLSNMTHEFRTPVNSIIGLCNLIGEDRHRAGQELEQEVVYIRKAAEQLGELVNDLLDLAKVEAGKTSVRAVPVDVSKLFGALRGMLRPLLLNQAVALTFDAAGDLPALTTDEAKVSQILRNLISNALKFTERGEVRVGATLASDAKQIAFTVSDTGIGIAADDQQRIFEEFTQIEHRLQRGVRGTGLGLPLSKRLAELLGGTISVVSEPGVGSTFSVTLPVHYSRPEHAVPEFDWRPEPGHRPVLVVDDAADEQLIYEKLLKGTGFQVYPAATVEQAEHALGVMHPAVVILDIRLGGGVESWDLLLRLRRNPRTADIPVIVVTALDERERALALGAQACFSKPVPRRVLLDTMAALTSVGSGPMRVLLVEDEEISRYLIEQALDGAYQLTSCTDAEEGLREARAQAADVILLDLMLPGITGWEMLDTLRDDASTRDVPVIVVTGSALDEEGRTDLLRHARDVISKADLTRERLLGAIAAVVGR
jgi:signal transduction histidine kinase/DNA-binding response OmpR family regulator